VSRQTCLVPFCKHTRRDDGRYSEWICAQHWRGVDRQIRRLYARIRREKKRAPAACDYTHVEGYTWARARREAIENGVGL
jgi:hypothetical protein